MQKSEKSFFIERIIYAIIGQVLPKPSVLLAISKNIRKAMLATVVTGILIASLILLSCFGWYHFLLTQGVDKLPAITVTVVILVMLVIVAAVISEKYFNSLKSIKSELSLFSHDQEKIFEVLYTQFVKGFCSHDEKREKTDEEEYCQERQEYSSAADAPINTEKKV